MARSDGGYGKEILSQVVGALFIGIVAATVTFYHRRKPNVQKNQKVIPRIDRTGSGRFGKLERFSDYVARQLEFSDANECPQLRKLTFEYLRKSKGCEDSIYEYFSGEPEVESLCVKLIEEIDKCILSYFAFNWSQSSLLISQRFARVTKDLKMTRMFSTLMEEMKAIGTTTDSNCTNVMAPVAHNQRSPVLLLMGGGMGAGKSTVLKDILKQPLWSEAAANAVVVEADAFKETDVIYKALSSSGHHHDILQTAELVHQSSTDAASSLLVTALNEGRDVIMDGTLSWEPFVVQTIEMARNVHKSRFRMGVGYQVKEDGTVIENYWEQIEEQEEDGDEVEKERRNRKPYRIELVGVVCDAYLAVVRGIRRAVMVGRAVRVNSQLKSHKRFASAFPSYCQLVDNARLYCTNAMGGAAKLIGWKDGDSNLLVDPDEIKCLNVVSNLNDDADSIYELYADQGFLNEPGSIWKEIVSSPSRKSLQLELRTSIQAIEKSKASSSATK